MTLTKRHIDKVLNVKGYAFVDPAEAPNLTQRYTESYIRRRLFALEDETIITLYQAYRQAYDAIEGYANRRANELGIRQLANNPIGLTWRRLVTRYAQARLRQLGDQVARLAYDKVVLSYLVSYYGKLWMLDSMTANDVVRVPRLTADDASQAVMAKQLLEDVGNQIIYDNLGVEWREVYATELDDVILRIRRSLTRGMGQGKTIRELMHDVANDLGVTTDRRRTGIPDVRANFNRVQTITRSYFIDNNNRAALGAYGANADVVGGVKWLTANDGRACPQCSRLAGQVWALDDITMKHPVSDTHPQCRCSLVPMLHDEMPNQVTIDVVADDATPQTSFTNWLISYGLGVLLQDFIGRELDSTRI